MTAAAYAAAKARGEQPDEPIASDVANQAWSAYYASGQVGAVGWAEAARILRSGGDMFQFIMRADEYKIAVAGGMLVALKRGSLDMDDPYQASFGMRASIEERLEHARSIAPAHPQIEAASLLAWQHGHEWAVAQDGTPSSWDEARRVHRQYLDEGRGGPFLGVQVPVPDDECVRWATTTGRLRWHIYRDGTTLLIVTRPGDIVAATATVGPRASTIAVHVNGDVAEERHLVALVLALAALGVDPERYAS